MVPAGPAAAEVELELEAEVTLWGRLPFKLVVGWFGSVGWDDEDDDGWVTLRATALVDAVLSSSSPVGSGRYGGLSSGISFFFSCLRYPFGWDEHKKVEMRGSGVPVGQWRVLKEIQGRGWLERRGLSFRPRLLADIHARQFRSPFCGGISRRYIVLFLGLKKNDRGALRAKNMWPLEDGVTVLHQFSLRKPTSW